jgi:hypothetical protein
VDNLLRKAGPVLADQAPSPQLMGSGEATYLVLKAASECRSSRKTTKTFILFLISRVSLYITNKSRSTTWLRPN